MEIAMDFEKMIVDLGAKCDWLEMAKTNLIEEVTGLKAREINLKEKNMKLKDECMKMEEKLHSEQSKWKEERLKISEKCSRVVLEKKILDIDLKAAEAEVKSLKGLMEQRDGPVTNLLGKIEAFDRQNSKLESDLKAAKMRSRELEKALLDCKSLREEEDSIAMLGREKRKIREEGIIQSDESGTKYLGNTSAFHKNKQKKAMCNVNSEWSGFYLDGKKFEVERIDVNNDLEAEKRELEKARKKINELSEMVAVSKAVMEAEESDKRAMEDEHKKKVLELTLSIKILEGEKREVEDRLIQATGDYRDEIKRISYEKIALEAEKRTRKVEGEREVSEQACRIEVLECENRDMEVELSEAKREKKEEIKRIVNEMAALKEKNEELVARVSVLRELLVQQKECMAAEKVRTKMVINKCTANSMEHVQLPYQVHLVSNAGILGRKSFDLSIRNPQRQKVEDLGCSVSNQVGIKRSKSGSVWTTPQKMLNDLSTNNELCLRSICALYRKHKSLGCWKNCSNNGFMPPYEARGVDLGELLTRGDPEGRLKMSLAEFEQADPHVLQDCRLIASDHYKGVFEIYSHNLDPLF